MDYPRPLRWCGPAAVLRRCAGRAEDGHETRDPARAPRAVELRRCAPRAGRSCAPDSG